jgi:hypothetical protein
MIAQNYLLLMMCLSSKFAFEGHTLLLFVIEAILHVNICYILGHILETKSGLLVYSMGIANGGGIRILGVKQGACSIAFSHGN